MESKDTNIILLASVPPLYNYSESSIQISPSSFSTDDFAACYIQKENKLKKSGGRY